jgi:hypothetical protein
MRHISVFMIFLFLASCSGNGDVVTADKDIADGGTTADQVASPDSATPPDASGNLDLTKFEQVDEELIFPDVPDSLSPGCNPGSGCFLDKCDTNEECLSGWCVEHLGEGVCSQSCQDECPPGWECQQVAGTVPDVVYICVSTHANLCRPCAAGTDCKSVGGAEDVCVDYEGAGAFCGGVCATDDDCPWGFSCLTTVTVDGIDTLQCLADAGECPCTGKSVALSLWTPCEAENEFGICDGKRVCAEEGLLECDALVPAAEVCNGLDDNCDGEVDEATCDDDNECTEDSCLAAEGCQNVALDLGECKDGNPCTVADHCEAGACIGDPVLCDDQNPCTEDLCTEQGGCDHPFVFGPCDDEDPCTVGDQCGDGECAGTHLACDCSEDSDCGELEDGDLCNGTLVCDVEALPMKCVVAPNTVVSCPEPAGADAPCLVPACDPASGGCSLVPANDGAPCDDGDSCSLGDTCSDGSCTPGAPANCNDGNPCTDDSCDPDSGCTSEKNSDSCTDGDVCTVNDVCAGGQCLPGDNLDCDDGNPCTDDMCDSAVGCLHTNNLADCDDGNACTTGDVCGGGQCAGGTPVSCDDENICTSESCNPADGCIYTFNSAPCSDDDVCTLSDMCNLGECVSSGSLTCADLNPCTDDSCNALSGCQFVANQEPCSDGNACTEPDICSGGSCIAGSGIDCDDENPCTNDACDPQWGCIYSNNTLPCDDSDACTLSDTCDGGSCIGGPALDCDDENLCTNDDCDAENGCVYQFNTTPCNDDDPCTVTDGCSGGACVGTGDLDCDDDVVCTADSCIEGVGCQNTVTVDYETDGNNCGECGLVCGETEKCKEGECKIIDPWLGAGAQWESAGKYFGRFTWAQAGIGNNGRFNATDYCVGKGGTLARPNSQDEWDKLFQNIPNDNYGYWMDGHNNYICGEATPGNPKPYQFGMMHCPTGTTKLYTGCNCTQSEPGLVVYRYSGSGHFDGCQSHAGGGNLGAMDENIDYNHAAIHGFVCEK